MCRSPAVVGGTSEGVKGVRGVRRRLLLYDEQETS